MITDLDARERMLANASLLREYAGTEGSNALLALLNSMIDVYHRELVDVAPDDLLAKQGAARQVRQLRDLVTMETSVDPTI